MTKKCYQKGGRLCLEETGQGRAAVVAGPAKVWDKDAVRARAKVGAKAEGKARVKAVVRAGA